MSEAPEWIAFALYWHRLKVLIEYDGEAYA